MPATRVLLIESEETDYHLLRIALDEIHDSDYELKWVAEHDDAVEELRSNQYDVCLVDNKIGGLRGVDLINEIADGGVNLPIILLTSKTDRDVDVASSAAGAMDYLVKEFVTPPLLERSIRYAISRFAVLRELQEYAAIVQNSDDAILGKTLQGTVTSWNKGAERIYGYKASEIVGRSIEMVVPGERRQELRNILEAITAGVRVDRLMTQRLTKHGRLIDVSLTISPIKDAAGKVVGASSIARDVTLQKAAVETVARSEAQMAEAQKVARIGTWEHDLRSNTVTWSDGFRKLIGLESEAAVTDLDTFRRLVHPEDRKKMDEVVRSSFTDSPAETFEGRVIRPDGNEITIQSRWRLLKDPQNQPLRMIGATIDISDIRRAEREARRNQELLQSIIDGSSAVIYVKDLEGRFVLVNNKLRQVFGLSNSDVIGKRPSVLFPKDIADMMLASDRQVMETGDPVEVEELVPHDQGPILYLSVKFPLKDMEGQIYAVAGISTDITERRSLEEQLRQAQKMEAVGQLAGGVAHDFNNLLTVITGHSSLALRALVAKDPVRRHLDEIRKASDRAAALTRQLLAFSRRQILSPRVVRVNDVVTDIETMIRTVLTETIVLTIKTRDEVGQVNVDPIQIEQVILNLALNARDAMPAGGELTIETDLIFLDEEYSQLHIETEPGWYAVVAISDTGTGMDEATRQHIFEPFFTTKGTSGTGLGLATVYGIVKQSGGNIWVYSEPGIGTTFKIYLPLVDTPPDERLASTPDAVHQKGDETILLVEDEEIVREFTRESLALDGYTLITARSGAEALKKIEEQGADIDLVITDVVMPGMNGGELVRELRQSNPGLRVLFMSGYTDDAAVHRGMIAEDVPFLQKPFSSDQLARKVREVLDE